MRIVLVVDDRLLCAMEEDWLIIHGHEVEAFTEDEAAAAWCERPGNVAGAVLISLTAHGAGAGLTLAGRIAKAQPEARITVTSGVFRKVPAHMPQTIRLLTSPYTSKEFLDLGI